MNKIDVLDIDVGNSRIKWRLLSGQKRVAVGNISHDEFASVLTSLRLDYSGDMRARIACVAGTGPEQQIRECLLAADVNQIEFAQVEREVAGVVCGYDDLGSLGVDRWMAVLAAAAEYDGPLVVADCGSALNLEVITAAKRYQGGYILPGWSLQHMALISGTALVADQVPDGFKADVISPGTSTREAIGMGRLMMMAAAVDRAVDEHSRLEGSEVTLVMTGGYADIIAKHLRNTALFRPQLVLEGLSIALD